MTARRVGIVGLGIMGGAMARNLLERGWQVTGTDLDASRMAALAGLEPAVSAAAIGAEIVITSLPSAAAALDVARDIAGTAAPRIVVETSTLAIAHKLALRDVLEAAGHVALDCPLSGTGAQAAVRDLVVYASGDPAAIERCRPVFADFARAAHDVGAYGNGSRMKFVANLLVAIHNVAAAEAMLLAERGGLDPAQVVRLAGDGAGGSRMFDLCGSARPRGRANPLPAVAVGEVTGIKLQMEVAQ